MSNVTPFPTEPARRAEAARVLQTLSELEEQGEAYPALTLLVKTVLADSPSDEVTCGRLPPDVTEPEYRQALERAVEIVFEDAKDELRELEWNTLRQKLERLIASEGEVWL